MTSNIFSHRVLRRESISVEKSGASKLQQELQTSNNFNIPTVNVKKQSDGNIKPSIRLKGFRFTGEMPTLDENRELKNPNEQIRGQRKESIFEEIGILSKYIRDIQKNKKSQEVQITYRKQLSQSVKVSESITERKGEYTQDNHQTSIRIQNPRSKTLHTVEESKKNLKVRFTPLTEENEELDNSNFSHKITIFQKRNTKLIINQSKSKVQSVINKKFTLRIIVLFVRAAMRLSKKYRMIHQKRLFEYTKLSHLREPHKQYIEKFQYEYVKRQHRKFVEIISKKILFYLDEHCYIRECQLIWQKQGNLEQDLRRTRFCVLSKMLMQNLEFLTRGDNLPHLIQHQLNNCLFKSKERLQSQFVANRGLLYSKQITTISQENKILIAAEYFFFQIICPNIIELFNELQTEEAAHKNQSLYYGALLINLLSALFVSYFSRMTIQERSNIIPIQRKFSQCTNKATGQMDLNIEIIQKLDEDESKIVSGYFQKHPIKGILAEREQWTEKMQIFFSQIISNLFSHITV